VRPVDENDTTTVTIGDTDVIAVVDVLTSLPTGRLFAATPLPWPIAELDHRFPDDFTDGHWRFIMRSFVLRHPTKLIMVDAGAGPRNRPLCQELQTEGNLLGSLRSARIRPEDVSDVVITHFHDDHVGWLTLPQPADQRITFPNAVYHLHPADLAVAETRQDERGRHYWHEVFAPLTASGRLNLNPDSQTLASGIELVNAPGHTPGHRIVKVSADDHELLIVGDLLHFSYQLQDPTLPSPFDTDPVRAAPARVAILQSAPHALVASPHLPHAFTAAARLT
jgi:glyoxylase-like metal-dependent hydrolase (beta-lactamase superfamily II)